MPPPDHAKPAEVPAIGGLRACPFCNSTQVIQRFAEGGYWVACDICEADAPTRAGLIAEIDAWFEENAA